MRGTIVVSDGGERASLAVVRSLGRAGWRVVTCGSTAATLAGRSRYSARSVTVPDPLGDPHGFAEQVIGVTREEKARFLVPVSEAALLALLPVRHELPPGCIPWPDIEVVRAICDKQRVLEAAPAFGIGVPGQSVLESHSVPVPDRVSYPVVMKPSRSVASGAEGRYKLQVRHASSRLELEQVLGALPASAYPVLLQERVVGPGVGIFLLVWDGTVRAAFAHERLREKPPSGGVSVVRKSIAAPAGLVEQSRQLLAHFGWQGVAMVEYKIDARTGTPVLMEINGRFWGSLQLAIDSGVDFPALLMECAEGNGPAAPGAYRAGTRLRWWWGDVDQLLLRLRRSDAELGLPSGAPGRLQAIGEFLASFGPRDRNEILRFDDLAPAVHETLQWFRQQ